jgi:hypothetical protein
MSVEAVQVSRERLGDLEDLQLEVYVRDACD